MKKYCDRQCSLWYWEDELFLKNRTQLKIERIARIKFEWDHFGDDMNCWIDKNMCFICMEDRLIERDEFKPYLETE